MILRNPRFIDSVVEAALHIAADNRPAADRFVDALDRTLQLLDAKPHIGRPFQTSNRRLRSVRYTTVRGFRNWLLFYRVHAKDVHALVLIHPARDTEALLGEDL